MRRGNASSSTSREGEPPWGRRVWRLCIAALAAAFLAGCASPPHFLGAPVPDTCASRDVDDCAGWMAERDLVAGQIDAYGDAALRAYVQGITDRLARAAGMPRSPRVVIADHEGTYAAFGERIVVGRMTIERLASEAELAAVVAHELAHVEGRHASLSLFGPDVDAAWLAARRDAEAIADERAVTLLERAGYAPDAMSRALAASLDVDDNEHPPRADRLAAVNKLAAVRDASDDELPTRPFVAGFEGRAAFMRRIEGMIVGRDTELGTRVGDAWVIAALGVAIELRATDLVHVDGDALVLRRGRGALTAYPIGAAWARELAATLSERTNVETRLGPLTVGIATEAAPPTTAIAKLARFVRELLPQPAPGTWVLVLVRPRGGLVVEVAANTDVFTRNRWLAGLRAASRAELTLAAPPRISIREATTGGKLRDLVEACPDPYRALQLEDPTRVLASGELFKCTDR
jgi:hypothetical protein